MKPRHKLYTKPIAFCAAVAGMVASTSAADINWQTPQLVTGASDVSTLGTFHGSWAPYNQPAVDNNGLAVNGVTFQAFTDLPGFSTGEGSFGFGDGYGSYNNPNTSDANYNSLMQSAAYNGSGSGTPTITWGGLTLGNTYLVQLWANDGRGNGRSMTVTGGANTSGSLVFGNSGQYVVGTFVADSTTETIMLVGDSPANGNYPQINLLQVREIAVVPEPSALALLAGGAFLCAFRPKSKVA